MSAVTQSLVAIEEDWESETANGVVYVEWI